MREAEVRCYMTNGNGHELDLSSIPDTIPRKENRMYLSQWQGHRSELQQSIACKKIKTRRSPRHLQYSSAICVNFDRKNLDFFRNVFVGRKIFTEHILTISIHLTHCQVNFFPGVALDKNTWTDQYRVSSPETPKPKTCALCVCLALHIEYIVKYKAEVWEASTFLLEKQISVFDKYKGGFNSLSNRFLKMKANKAKLDSSWLLGIK